MSEGKKEDELFNFLETSWNTHYGILERKNKRGYDTIELHTGGWSENEETITEAEQMFDFEWNLCIQKWERGGHYYLKNPLKQNKEARKP